jgi:peptidoglycan/xylan/chitin deacetylase (PgdA/CDA1 family)
MTKTVLTIAATVLCLLGSATWMMVRARDHFAAGDDGLILLVPDTSSFSDPRVVVWLDAASEEGLHVIPMHDSSFLSPLFGRPRCAGLILPDSIHDQANDLLIDAIRDYVSKGGHLMLVFDAATKSIQGFYPAGGSRFFDLAGVDYAMYKDLGDTMIRSGDLSSTVALMKELGVPPGKYFPFVAPSEIPEGAFSTRLRRYQYGNLEYPSFVTSGDYAGQVLLRSNAVVAAGSRRYGNGAVLFVNLPLGYLKSNADGLPLHTFLTYFAEKMLSLPHLLAVPDGVGGLVLNWHVDSNAAISALQAMNTWPILQQGPYSIHITAGPDTYVFGDHKGFNVLHNSVSEDLLREYVRLGDEIGSHGGWIHEYFGAHVATDAPDDMAKLLELNNAALEQTTGHRVVEYSAPNGDQPEWTTRWLESHGFVAYYFTGDAGMGPTQGYSGGHREGKNIWAFPIAQLDRAASFEEFNREGVSSDVIQQWLEALTGFVVNRHEVRLVYFHPPGILPYHDVVCNWMEKTAQLSAERKFRWYTMAQIANFLNMRKGVRWNLTQHNGLTSLSAAGSQTLAHQTWSLPGNKIEKPVVIQGAATIVQDGGSWLVVAGEGTQLEIEARTFEK